MSKSLVKYGITLFTNDLSTYTIPLNKVQAYLKSQSSTGPFNLGYVSSEFSLIKNQSLDELLEMEGVPNENSFQLNTSSLQHLLIYFKENKKTVEELNVQEKFMLSLYKTLELSYENILVDWDVRKLEPLAMALVKKIILHQSKERHFFMYGYNLSLFNDEASHVFDGKSLHSITQTLLKAS
jgi:hypothetical protein